MKRIALPTLHKKGDQIIPAFREIVEFEIEEVAIDTDSFGTFAGEIERTLAPLDAAIAKAQQALAVTGWDGAIASEGSIGSDPEIPFLISDREVMVFLDASDQIVIHESYRSFEIIMAEMEFTSGEDIGSFLKKADFPNHGLIVSTDVIEGRFIVKGIRDRASLESAIAEALGRSKMGSIKIGSDLRAHLSPSRQLNISRVAERLAARIRNRCPSCESQGWGRVDFHFGVKCEECDHLDRRIVAREISGCVRCDYRADGVVVRRSIGAQECERCNP